MPARKRVRRCGEKFGNIGMSRAYAAFADLIR
jgi:hypothetical protein